MRRVAENAMDRFELTTDPSAPAERVWEPATSIEMTVSRGVGDAERFGRKPREGTLPLPAKLGWSWVLLADALPSRAGDGSLVTDCLAWETRALVLRAAAASTVSAIFGHRHRRLTARFGRPLDF